MKVLLVDVSSVVHRNVHAQKFLEDDATYSVLSSIAAVIEAGRFNGAVLCFDAPPYKRTEQFEQYKGDRDHRNNKQLTDEQKEAHRKIKKTQQGLLELSQQLNIPYIKIKGFEADDAIAWCCEQLSPKECIDEIAILSSDSDLYQLLAFPKVTMMKRKGNSYVVYSKADFEDEFGVDPSKWVSVLSLCGTHNAIPGIPGIGIKRALAALRSPITLNKMLSKYSYKEQFKINQELIQLPHAELYNHINENEARIKVMATMRDVTSVISKQGYVTPTIDSAFRRIIHK